MSTVEQKLQKIEGIILQKANARADDLIFKAMAKKNESLEKKELEVLQRKYKEINKETMEIRKKTTQYISNFEIKNKRELLLKKDDFCNRIFESVFIKLCNFAKTSDYELFFKNKIADLNLNDQLDNLTFFIKNEDEILKNLILNNFDNFISIKEVSDIKIGGMKIINQHTGLCIDETLDTKLDEQKLWFYSHSDLLSY